MAADAPQPSAGMGGELPSSLLARRTWRSPAGRARDLLLASIAARTEPLQGHAARPLRWYQQLAWRVQPWSGWGPVAMEVGRAEPASDGIPVTESGWAMAGRAEPPPSRESPRTAPVGQDMYAGASIRVGDTGRSGGLARGLGQTMVQRATSLVLRAAPGRPRVEPSPSQAALRLASVRVRPAGTDVVPRLEGDGGSRAPLGPAGPPAGSPPAVAGPSFEPRLALSVAPNPRQEVRGGFPVHPALPLPTQPAMMDALVPAVPATSPRGSPVLSSALSADRGDGARRQTPPGAIERLLERTVVPVPLPGLEVRLIAPEPTGRSSLQTSGPEPEARGDVADTLPPAPRPPTPAPAPQLDIDAVADQVYRTLQRRQQLERERRGMY